MRDLAVELGPLGITVNNVAPGAIATPINTALLEDKPNSTRCSKTFLSAAWALPRMSLDWLPFSRPTMQPT